MSFFQRDPDAPDTHRMPTLACPHCGHRLTGTSTFSDQPTDAPRDGDMSLCIVCHELAVFVVGASGVSQRIPTPDELAVIEASHGDILREWREGPDFLK